MGISTNYKKKIEYENLLWNQEYATYNKEIEEIRKKIEVACVGYNQEVATINSERSSLKDVINKLYEFLKEFGKIGTKITHFDFVNEKWQTIDIDALINSANAPEISQVDHMDIKTSVAAASAGTMGILFSAKTTLAISTMLNPVLMASALVPAIVVPNFLKRGKKKDYLDCVRKHKEAIAEYSNNKEKLNDVYNSIVLITNIAKLYYGTIGTIKEAITDTVLPELSGIKAFLYATTIAEKYATGEIVLGIVPADIMEFEGTRYNEHFVFVKNTVDYYTLIVTLFTKQILTKMFEDNELTEDEKLEFEEQIKQLDAKREFLIKNSRFKEEVLI